MGNSHSQSPNQPSYIATNACDAINHMKHFEQANTQNYSLYFGSNGETARIVNQPMRVQCDQEYTTNPNAPRCLTFNDMKGSITINLKPEETKNGVVINGSNNTGSFFLSCR